MALSHEQFYNWTVPAPADTWWFLQREWGADVMQTIKIKRTAGGDGGSFSGMWRLDAPKEGESTAPPLPIDATVVQETLQGL